MNPPSSSSSSSQHVRVAVHVRPLLPGETGDLDSVSIEGGRKVLFGAAAAGSNCSTNGEQQQQQQNRSAVAFDLAAGLSAGGVDPALLYDTCVAPLVEGLFEGFNASVLAYGPTGSGKTFTMGTDFSGKGGGFSSGNGNDNGVFSSAAAAAAATAVIMPGGGIVPRVAQDLFSRVERVLREGKEGEGEEASFSVDACSVRVGFVEVYAEEVRDLLSGEASSSGSPAAPFSTSSAAPKITLRDSESSKNSSSPLASSGAAEVEVKTAQELDALLSSAGKRRATGATAVNAASSRSHAIVTLTVEQRGRRRRRRGSGVQRSGGGTAPGGENEEGEERTDAATEGPETTVSAKMCLVDLAGSERQKRTLATGARLKEATAINRGLLALGNVIGALAAQSKAAATAAGATTAAAGTSSNPSLQQHRHIPYRDSKLTRLLADALGGASRTLLIACVSRADIDADEAAATLRYAARARAIVNVPRANIASASEGCCAGSLCAANAAELESLRMELVGARSKIAALERELSMLRKKEKAVSVPAAAEQQFSVRPSSETAARYAAEAAAARRRAAALRTAAAATADGGGGGGAGAAEASAAAETTAKIISPASSRPPLPPAPGPLAAGAALRAVGRKQATAPAAATTTATKPQPLSLPPSSSSSFATRVALSSVDGNSPERKQQQPAQSSSRW